MKKDVPKDKPGGDTGEVKKNAYERKKRKCIAYKHAYKLRKTMAEKHLFASRRRSELTPKEFRS